MRSINRLTYLITCCSLLQSALCPMYTVSPFISMLIYIALQRGINCLSHGNLLLHILTTVIMGFDQNILIATSILFSASCKLTRGVAALA